MQHSFTIGVHEKHVVQVSFDQFWGKFEVRVDGMTIRKDLLIFSFAITKNWDFWVGMHERHFVRIQKERPVLFAAFSPHTYRIFINGVLVQQFEA